MKKSMELYEIDNGYLIKFIDAGNKTDRIRSYQVHTTNNQIPLMFSDVLFHLKEHKNYKVVNSSEAAKLYAISQWPNDRTSQT